MAEEKKEEEAAASGEEESGGFSNKIILILSILNTLAVVGISAFTYMGYMQQKKESELANIEADAENTDASEAHHEEGADAAAGGHGAPAAGGHGGDAGAGGAHKTKTAHQFGVMVPLEQFTVNLVAEGTGAPKFARVDISIEVAQADTEGELGTKMPQVRNTIIDLFNSKRPADLATVDGRNYLKEEIKNALNSFLVTGKVSGVFFTSFNLSG